MIQVLAVLLLLVGGFGYYKGCQQGQSKLIRKIERKQKKAQRKADRIIKKIEKKKLKYEKAVRERHEHGKSRKSRNQSIKELFSK